MSKQFLCSGTRSNGQTCKLPLAELKDDAVVVRRAHLREWQKFHLEIVAEEIVSIRCPRCGANTQLSKLSHQEMAS